MILADTSIWVDHLRHGDAELMKFLNSGQVLTHPFIIGELALGSMQNRNMVLSTMKNLPQATVASDEEVWQFIENHALSGTGIGYIDAHLLAATRLTPSALLWTRDKRLLAESTRLGLCMNATH
jgi:predicted nucleic acid-binding protein